MKADDWAIIVLSIIFFPVGTFLLYGMFVIMPVAFYTDAECLRKGFPKSTVTIGLERYCMNLDGTITVKVEKASEAK